MNNEKFERRIGLALIIGAALYLTVFAFLPFLLEVL